MAPDLNKDGESMSEGEITRQFREDVIKGLATLDAGVKGINQRLDRVNGSVKELYLKSEQNKAGLMDHVANCPLKDKIVDLDVLLATASHPSASEVDQKLSVLEKKVEKHFVEKDTSAKWWKLLQPVIWAAAGTFLMLVVQHADKIFGK